MLNVNTIYPAFMGEVNKYGIGVPCTFVRLSGCNLRCYKKTKGILCDTPEALGKSGKSLSESEIVDKVTLYGNKVVCLTGGEPLIQDVGFLLRSLSNSGFHVVIETNGSVLIQNYRHIRNVSFIVDVKSKSSGESDKMHPVNYRVMDENDFVKFVIDTVEDYEEMKNWISQNSYFKGNIAVGLFWGSKMSYSDLMQSIHKDKLNVYLNMQTHKMSCLYDYYKDSLDKITIPKEL